MIKHINLQLDLFQGHLMVAEALSTSFLEYVFQCVKQSALVAHVLFAFILDQLFSILLLPFHFFNDLFELVNVFIFLEQFLLEMLELLRIKFKPFNVLRILFFLLIRFLL